MILKTPKTVLEEFFKSSTIWQDINTILDDWIEAVRIDLENSDLSLDLRELDHRGGVVSALRRVKHIHTYITYEEEENDGRE